MALKTHLNEMVKRHQKIEQALAEALLHPSIDDLEIRSLKLQKLKLKDQISSLRAKLRLDVRMLEAA